MANEETREQGSQEGSDDKSTHSGGLGREQASDPEAMSESED